MAYLENQLSIFSVFILEFLLIFCFSLSSFAQNLVPNPSFEISGTGVPSFPPWQNAGNGSADYFVAPTSAPGNFIGFQNANTGNAYVGAFIGRTGGATAENITTQLQTSMIAGHKYLVSFYVSHADQSKYAIDKIGVLVTNNMVAAPGGASPHITALPSLSINDFNFLTDTFAWKKLQWIYTASGNETWINIGCFAPNGVNSYGHDTLSNPNGSWNSSYYYFDDVCVLDLMGAPATTQSIDTTICTFPASLHATSNGTGFIWNTGDTSATIQINNPGTYWVKTFQECSFSVDTIIVKLGFPSQTRSTKDTFFCQGTQFTLSAQQAGQNYEWHNGNNTSNLTINQAGTYWVKYDLPNCHKHTDTFRVIHPDDPALMLPDTIVCNQNDVYITTDTAYTSWLWSTGSEAKGLYIDKDGTYWVEVLTQNGCRLRDTFTVSFVDTRQYFRDTIFCNNQAIDFILQTKTRNSATFEWQDGSRNSYYHIKTAGVYTVKVQDGICSSESEITVNTEYCDCDFKIPSAFSPNNDGNNDQIGALFPPDCQVRGYLLRIYNRWGQLIFESYDVNKKWDGYFNGKQVDIGVYHYYIQFEKGTKNNMVTQRGDITLIR